MLPDTITVSDEIYDRQPSLTYFLDATTERVTYLIDNAVAMQQAIEKILSTERYDHVIYDWHYGREIVSLLGKPYDFVVSEAQRIITEALMQDDRIIGVDSFVTERTKLDEMSLSFVVNTIYGELNYGLEVSI